MFKEAEEGIVVFSAPRGGSGFAMDNNYKPTKKPSKPKIKEYMSGSNAWLSPWGDDNLWPKTVLDSLRCCAPAQVCIEILVALFYGNGIQVYERNSDGSVKRVFDNEQQEWFRQTLVSRYQKQAAKDYFTLANQYPQLLLNKQDKPGIGAIVNISAPWCRLGARPSGGDIGSVYIHGSWENMPAEAECDKVQLLSPYDAADEIMDAKDVTKFMMQTGNYTPGNLYYNENPFHALVRNGTMDIFSEIPKIRKRRIKDAMFIKYHVRINEMYWWGLYGGMEKGKAAWENMSYAERKAARETVYSAIDKQLTGSSNAFKSLFSSTYYDTNTRQTINLLDVTLIETEVGESAAFDPDKMTAVADVFLAFGLPSAIGNTVLSDSKSRGGGSDIREGNTSVIARMPEIRDEINAPIDFAMRFTKRKDGSPLLLPNQFLAHENTVMTTLDESKSGTKNTDPIKSAT